MAILPPTQWQETDGNYESVSTGVNFIVDTLLNFLVDPTGVFIVDTGVEMVVIPATIWTGNEGI